MKKKPVVYKPKPKPKPKSRTLPKRGDRAAKAKKKAKK